MFSKPFLTGIFGVGSGHYVAGGRGLGVLLPWWAALFK